MKYLAILLLCSCAAPEVEPPQPAQEPTLVTLTQDSFEEVTPGLYLYPGMFNDEFVNNHLIPLVEDFTLSYDLRIVVVYDWAEKTGSWASTSWDEELQSFWIVFDHTLADLSHIFILEVLFHEYAHAMVWDVPLEGAHHAAWGVYRAALYAHFIDE